MKQEFQYWVAESADDFKGWEILLIEDWKPGIKRVHIRLISPNGQGSFRMVYSKEEYTKELRVN